jgi:predicted DNA-binding protein
MRKLDKEKLMALSKFEGVATNVLIRKLIDNYIDTMENQMTLFKLSEQQKNA